MAKNMSGQIIVSLLARLTKKKKYISFLKEKMKTKSFVVLS